MQIVIGSGKRRNKIVFASGSVFKNAPENEQKQFISNFCSIAGIKTD